MEVAKKLNVEIWDKNTLLTLIQSVDSFKHSIKTKQNETIEDWFFEIWNNNIKKLKGQKIKHLSRDTYITIIDVYDDGLSIINSNGKKKRF